MVPFTKKEIPVDWSLVVSLVHSICEDTSVIPKVKVDPAKLVIPKDIFPNFGYGKCLACYAYGLLEPRYGFPFGTSTMINGSKIIHTEDCPMNDVLLADGTLKEVVTFGEIGNFLRNHHLTAKAFAPDGQDSRLSDNDTKQFDFINETLGKITEIQIGKMQTALADVVYLQPLTLPTHMSGTELDPASVELWQAMQKALEDGSYK